MADIILISPRFETSFWGMEHALPILGPRALMPPSGLLLLAALTPSAHQVTIIDENIEAIDFDRCRQADIIGVTGMSVQRHRIREILIELKQRGAFTVVGGPWATVKDDYFGSLADVVFIGEAEETWPTFLADWVRGAPFGRYEQAERTDVTRLPAPRYDLANMPSYAHGSVQFSRGCPFTCEFCDIIQTFGRRPRLKLPSQIASELDALYGAGMRVVLIVDDNLIGNKKGVKPLLREVIRWQNDRGYPMVFMAEASIDLAEDAELMELMVTAGIYAVFVGIESPNEDALKETRKIQNVRKGTTLLDRIQSIQKAGIEVWGGMIVGFDSDGPRIFSEQRRFIEDSRIAAAMVGMLNAIPKTPLYSRLLRANRLDLSDTPAHGTNVVPLQMDRRELRDGYVSLVSELYAPSAYFHRLDALYLDGRLSPGAGHYRYWRRRPLRGLAPKLALMAMSIGVALRLLNRAPVTLRQEYRWRIWRIAITRRSAIVLFVYVVRCAMHLHFYRLSQDMLYGTGLTPNTI